MSARKAVLQTNGTDIGIVRQVKPGAQNSSNGPCSGGQVQRLFPASQLHYEPDPQTHENYRESVCGLCQKVVSLALSIPLNSIRAPTRSTADVALARQIAMYLCHTSFGVILTEVGVHFGRDRTTVSHACALVENKRDDMTFDLMLCQIEAILSDARSAMEIYPDYQAKTQQNGEG